MTIFVGEAITIVAAAYNPVAAAVISDADAAVEFYAPGKSPATLPSDRVLDHGPFDMSFVATVVNADGTRGAYVGYADTTGWGAGRWSYKVTLSGSYESWEYGTFTLAS